MNTVSQKNGGILDHSHKFHLKMHCYLCSLLTEALHLNEHEAARWLAKDELDSVKWLPADLSVIETLKTFSK